MPTRKARIDGGSKLRSRSTAPLPRLEAGTLVHDLPKNYCPARDAQGRGVAFRKGVVASFDTGLAVSTRLLKSGFTILSDEYILEVTIANLARRVASSPDVSTGGNQESFDRRHAADVAAARVALAAYQAKLDKLRNQQSSAANAARAANAVATALSALPADAQPAFATPGDATTPKEDTVSATKTKTTGEQVADAIAAGTPVADVDPALAFLDNGGPLPGLEGADAVMAALDADAPAPRKTTKKQRESGVAAVADAAARATGRKVKADPKPAAKKSGRKPAAKKPAAKSARRVSAPVAHDGEKGAYRSALDVRNAAFVAEFARLVKKGATNAAALAETAATFKVQARIVRHHVAASGDWPKPVK